MKINIKAPLKTYQGKTAKTLDENNKQRDMIIRDAINLALNGTELTPQGQAAAVSVENKGKIYQLSTKLWSAGKEISLTTDEASFLKERAGKVANITPLVYGRLVDLLDK